MSIPIKITSEFDSKGIDAAKQGMKELGAAAQAAGRQVSGGGLADTKGVDELRKALAGLPSTFDEIKKAAKDTSGVDAAKKAMDAAAASAKALATQQADAAKQSQQFKDAIASGLGFAAFTTAAGAVGKLALEMFNGIKAAVAYNAGIEQQTIAFKTLLGSMDLAQARMASLVQFAAATPFQLPEVVKASRLLQTLTDGALATDKGLRMVGDAASAVGAPFEEIAMWAGRLYAGLKDGEPVGHATMRLTQLGLISGETKQRLEDMANSGALGAAKAMQVLEATFAKTGGAMIQQSTTLSGLWTTMKDTVSQSSGEWFKPLTDGLKEALKVALQLQGALPSDKGIHDESMMSAIKAARGQMKSAGSKESEAENLKRLKAQAADQQAIMDREGVAVTPNGVQYRTSEYNNAAQTKAQLEKQIAKYGAGGEADKAVATNQAAAAQDKEFALRADQAKKADEWQTKSADGLREKIQLLEHANDPLSAQIENLRSMRLEAEKELDLKRQNVWTDQEGEKVELEGRHKILELDKQIGVLGKQLVAERQAAEEQSAKEEEADAKTMIELEREKVQTIIDGQERVAKYRNQKAEISNDFRLTNVQKREKEMAALQAESAGIDGQIGELQGETVNDPDNQRMVNSKVNSLQNRKAGVQGQLGGLQTQADPNSVGDQMTLQMTNLQNQWGTMAQQMGQTFADTMNSAVSSISNGITGLIDGTKTWGEALRNIGSTVMRTLIQSIVEMGVKWVVTHVLMEGVSAAFSAFMGLLQAKDAAKTVAVEGTKTPVLATNAALATVGSWGGALIALLLLGGLIAAFAGGFKEGGYTGDGGTSDVAGVVHKGEFVIPANKVKEFGIPYFNQIMNGGAQDAPTPLASVMAQQGSTTPGANNISLAVMNSDAQMRNWMKSQEGRKAFVDLAREHYHEFA